MVTACRFVLGKRLLKPQFKIASSDFLLALLITTGNNIKKIFNTFSIFSGSKNKRSPRQEVEFIQNSAYKPIFIFLRVVHKIRLVNNKNKSISTLDNFRR